MISGIPVLLIPGAIPSFLSIVLLVFLASLTIRAGKTRRENQLFTVFCLLLLGHRLTMAGYRFLPQGEGVLCLFAGFHLVFVFILPVTVHYVHTALFPASRSPVKKIPTVLYGFSLVLLPGILGGFYFRITDAGIPEPGPAFAVFLAVALAVLSVYAVLTVERLFRLKDIPEKLVRLKTIYITAGILPSCFLIFGDALPFYGLKNFATGDFLFIPLGIFTFGILRHQILDNKGWFSFGYIPNFLTFMIWLPLVLAAALYVGTKDRLFHPDIWDRLFPLGLPPVISFFVLFSLATFCFQKGSRQVQTMVFGAKCALWGLLNLDISLLLILKDPDTALAINRIDHFFLVMQLGFCCHFFYYFTEFRKWMVFIAYTASLVFIPLTQSPHYLEGVYTYPWGFFGKKGFLFDALLMVVLFEIAMGTLVLAKKIRETKDSSMSFRQHATSLAAVLTMALVGLANIPAMSGINIYPFGTFISIPVLYMAYGVFRYDVVRINEYTKRRIWNSASALLILSGCVFASAILFTGLRHLTFTDVAIKTNVHLIPAVLSLSVCVFLALLSLKTGPSSSRVRLAGLFFTAWGVPCAWFLLFRITGTPSFIARAVPFGDYMFLPLALSGLHVFRKNLKEALALLNQVLYLGGILCFIFFTALCALWKQTSLWTLSPGVLFFLLASWVFIFKGYEKIWSALLALFFGRQKETLGILFMNLSDQLYKSRSFDDIAKEVGSFVFKGVGPKTAWAFFPDGCPGRFLFFDMNPRGTFAKSETTLSGSHPLFTMFSQKRHALTQEQVEAWIADKGMVIKSDDLLRSAEVLLPVYSESSLVCILLFYEKEDGSAYSVIERDFITRIGFILGPHIENARLLTGLETEIQNRTRDLTAALKEITLINRFIEKTNASLNLDDITAAFHDILSPFFRYRAVLVQLTDPEKGTLRIARAAGEGVTEDLKKKLESLSVPTGDGSSLSAGVAASGKTVYIKRLAPDMLQSGFEKAVHGMIPFASILILPMEIMNTGIGNVVFLSGEKPFDLDGKAVEKLEGFVRQIATAVNNASLYDKAEAAALAKSDFLARMSHEIRSPLNAILGMGELLSETRLTFEQDRYLDIMRNSGGLLLSVINGILDFSKLETDHAALETVPFDLFSLMEDIRAILATVAMKKGLAMDLTISPLVNRHLVGDPFKLSQILINLGDNAVRFTERGGVTLAVDRALQKDGENAVTFQVADTGIGIPEDKIALIFDSFTQAESSTTRRFGGTGLGLSISRKLVNLMGGVLSVDSEKGTGSLFSFTVKLPRADDPAGIEPVNTDIVKSGLKSSFESFMSQEKETAEPLNRPERQDGLSILLAEDILTNTLVVRHFLENLPIDLDVADNGSRAVEMFQMKRYDLVLMDIHMPGMDGFETMERLRRWEEEDSRATRRTPVVALSAHRIDCAPRGSFTFDAFLMKPFGKQALIRTIVDTAGPFENSPSILEQDGCEPDPELLEIASELKKEIFEEFPAMELAMEHGDFSTLTRLSHGFKGAACNCRLDELGRLFHTLHGYARTKEESHAQLTLHSIRTYLDRLAC
jgi:signal transduction histidine kinase/CheY-like chemotaxis protein